MSLKSQKTNKDNIKTTANTSMDMRALAATFLISQKRPFQKRLEASKICPIKDRF